MKIDIHFFHIKSFSIISEQLPQSNCRPFYLRLRKKSVFSQFISGIRTIPDKKEYDRVLRKSFVSPPSEMDIFY
jgi:hypothetical protein